MSFVFTNHFTAIGIVPFTQAKARLEAQFTTIFRKVLNSINTIILTC